MSTIDNPYDYKIKKKPGETELLSIQVCQHPFFSLSLLRDVNVFNRGNNRNILSINFEYLLFSTNKSNRRLIMISFIIAYKTIDSLLVRGISFSRDLTRIFPQRQLK